MPHRETVAWVAFSRLSTSNIILKLSGTTRRSPLGKVSSLLSSSTLFKFSAHSGSTSPSNIIQCLRSASPRSFDIIFLKILVNTPSVHSKVVPSSDPYRASLFNALGSIVYNSPLMPSILSRALDKMRRAADLPTATGPTITTPCRISRTRFNCSIFCTHISPISKLLSLHSSTSASVKAVSPNFVGFEPGKIFERSLSKIRISSATSFGTMLLQAPSIKTSFSTMASFSASRISPFNAFLFNPPALISKVFRARRPKS
mmetsp:Transcript_8689/g.12668  ORF Transcript_8689/g.12668 Transcript_8689/m.12668 type:complete len:259 (-) Transcript_8689:3404-4180(-)